MTQLVSFEGIFFSASALIPRGKQLLWNRGAPVLCVAIGAPIEDAECDHIQYHPDDYDIFRRRVETQASNQSADGECAP